MMTVHDMCDLVREWGIDCCVVPWIDPFQSHPTPVMLKCAESSARLMADVQRRRMMQ